ncbi:MAG: hypothetical protein WCO66_03895 [Candidatus Absconditabacteria bacterium]
MNNKSVFLNFAHLVVSKSGVYQMQALVGRLMSKSYEDQLLVLTKEYAKRHRKSLDDVESFVAQFWTPDKIGSLLLQNYTGWKRIAAANSIQQKAEIQVPPNIAEILLWFPMFIKKEIPLVDIFTTNNGLNRLGRICRRLSHLDYEHQLYYLVNLHARLSHCTFGKALPVIIGFWDDEKIALLLAYRSQYIIWRYPSVDFRDEEELLKIPVYPDLAEILLWFPFFFDKTHS